MSIEVRKNKMFFNEFKYQSMFYFIKFNIDYSLLSGTKMSVNYHNRVVNYYFC